MQRRANRWHNFNLVEIISRDDKTLAEGWWTKCMQGACTQHTRMTTYMIDLHTQKREASPEMQLIVVDLSRYVNALRERE